MLGWMIFEYNSLFWNNQPPTRIRYFPIHVIHVSAIRQGTFIRHDTLKTKAVFPYWLDNSKFSWLKIFCWGMFIFICCPMKDSCSAFYKLNNGLVLSRQMGFYICSNLTKVILSGRRWSIPWYHYYYHHFPLMTNQKMWEMYLFASL